MTWKKIEINKVTPRFDKTWYIKWIASVLILVATAARSIGGIPHIDLWFGLFGTLGWLWVGLLWHDRALILLNIVLVTLISVGLITFYFGKYVQA